MEDKRRLWDYNIQEENIIFIVLRKIGGGSIGNEASVKRSVKEFWERLKEYGSKAEEHKIDVWYYMGQSWHEEIRYDCWLFKIKLQISQYLNQEWIKSIKQALKMIKQSAPGLQFEWKMGDESTLFGYNKIFVTTNIIDQFKIKLLILINN